MTVMRVGDNSGMSIVLLLKWVKYTFDFMAKDLINLVKSVL